MLISIRAASTLLGLSESHIRKMILWNRFPSYRMGKRIIRVDPEEIRDATRMGKRSILDGKDKSRLHEERV